MNYNIELKIQKSGLKHTGTATIKTTKGEILKKIEYKSIYLSSMLEEIRRDIYKYEHTNEE